MRIHIPAKTVSTLKQVISPASTKAWISCSDLNEMEVHQNNCSKHGRQAKCRHRIVLSVMDLASRYCSDVITSAMLSQITGVSIVYSTVCSGADQRKHHSSASVAFVRGIHRWPVSFPHKGAVKRKMFPFDEVIVKWKPSFATRGPY